MDKARASGIQIYTTYYPWIRKRVRNSDGNMICDFPCWPCPICSCTDKLLCQVIRGSAAKIVVNSCESPFHESQVTIRPKEKSVDRECLQ